MAPQFGLELHLNPICLYCYNLNRNLIPQSLGETEDFSVSVREDTEWLYASFLFISS